ncbi:phosphoenolpyruvate hydrolase-like protein [Kribbella sp. VKM Ac-2527]|uniref:Phosphoenolpyruvate hydrolase-like protein n=1 Tax=Kribbella caucasensis TaxID=2512215 RepID=A0A4R6KJY9_9ACTN|nr:phosphoenolpyruvate hydrolase family protein [Kribbella sp. VKM Ac-2527]TDO51634.1 phosphoenolpyruvate hydrolase-like protein [Kribbella sp. VKM Ac-2527]
MASEIDDCVQLSNGWSEAARSVREDVLVLVHGGPVAEPGDAESVLRKTTGVHGFYGASSMERLPVERALTEQTHAFSEITF